jgi:exportin-5
MTDVDIAVAEQIAAAVETALNPSSSVSMESRQNAYLLCERFKETSPNCAPCGMYLAKKEYCPQVRHVGLQLFEHSIKHQWNNMQVEEKVFVKNNAMKLLAEGTHEMLDEPPHIKDALSRLVVEMIKREWPQQWPTMLQGDFHDQADAKGIVIRAS